MSEVHYLTTLSECTPMQKMTSQEQLDVFCANMKTWRNKMGLTHQDVADSLNIQRPSYTQMESGRNYPQLDTMNEIANAIGVPLWMLMVPPELQTIGALSDDSCDTSHS